MHQKTVMHLYAYKTAYKFTTCALLAGIADFLFYNMVENGWTLGLFSLLLLAAVILHADKRFHRRSMDIATLAALGLSLALMEARSGLAWWMYIATIIGLSLMTRIADTHSALTLAKNVIDYAISGWSRLWKDNRLMLRIAKRRRSTHHTNTCKIWIRHWLLPLGLSGIFIALFAAANPIIERWLMLIHWDQFFELLSWERVLYWLLVASFCWSVIRPRLPKRFRQTPAQSTVQLPASLAVLFNAHAIQTSLLLFNGLFFIQNMLDAVFIWSGVALPDGMTHAQYAHQGAYPLMATALLAAAFVLIAFKPGSESTPVIRALIYGWVGQNLFLVASATLRLTGYISEYSLTWLRLVGLIWMGLVALGLLLIVARIYLGKTNSWLIQTNSMALYATLYACSFINFGGIIAQYNVTHCYEAAGQGAALDVAYLQREIGTEALPALLWFEEHYPDSPAYERVFTAHITLRLQLADSMRDWRQWTLRDIRLFNDLQPSISY